MSHSENTARKFDTNFPEWLASKLWIERVDPLYNKVSRQAENRQWKREIEIERRSA